MPQLDTPRGPNRYRGWFHDQRNSIIEAYYNSTLFMRSSTTATTFPLASTFSLGLTVTASGLTVTAGGLTVTAGGLTITAGGLLVTAGRIREVMTPADIDAQNGTMTVAHIVGGILVHTSVTAAGTITTDTAANIIAGDSGVGALTANGQCITAYYINDGSQTVTFAGGTDVTVADTGNTVLINESAMLIFRRTSATQVTLYIV